VLSAALNGIPPALPRLPLSHCTTLKYLDAICAGRALQPQLCPVLRRPLVYTFYGRPRYRKPSAITTDEWVLPIGFVFAPSIQELASDVFPFDTGAFNAGLYRDYLPQGVSLMEFRMSPVAEAPGCLVAAFFGNNTGYVRGLTSVMDPLADVHVRALASLYGAIVGDRLTLPFDDRSRAIEVVFDRPLLFNGFLEAVIVPESVLVWHPERLALFETLDATVLSYMDQRPFNVLGKYEVVYELGVRFLREKGYIPQL
jgi:hypothetical protein